ncbi:MAG: bisanhydrobacterioruberin hydratase [Halobacteriota archaeon]
MTSAAEPARRDGPFSWLPHSRAEVELWLDAFVDGNRFTISVFFPIVGAVMLLGSASGVLPAPLSFNPPLILFGTAVMASPLLVGVLPTIDRRALSGIAILVAYTYLIEYLGVSTGWPYGSFTYGVTLGPMVDGIPAALPLFFLPIVANAYLLCLLLLGEHAESWVVRLAVVISAVVTLDVVLDPAAVSIGFWTYDAGGAFYGVPLSNYAGWVLSASVAVVVFDRAVDRAAIETRLDRCAFMLDDMVSFVILWGFINAWFGNWVPVAVAVLFGTGLLAVDRFDAGLLRPNTGLYVPDASTLTRDRSPLGDR